LQSVFKPFGEDTPGFYNIRLALRVMDFVAEIINEVTKSKDNKRAIDSFAQTFTARRKTATMDVSQ